MLYFLYVWGIYTFISHLKQSISNQIKNNNSCKLTIQMQQTKSRTVTLVNCHSTLRNQIKNNNSCEVPFSYTIFIVFYLKVLQPNDQLTLVMLYIILSELEIEVRLEGFDRHESNSWDFYRLLLLVPVLLLVEW